MKLKFKFYNKVYDVFKWVCLIALPACSILWTAISSIWHLGYITQVCGTIAAIETFIGSLIGISTAQYNAELRKELAKDRINEPEEEVQVVE